MRPLAALLLAVAAGCSGNGAVNPLGAGGTGGGGGIGGGGGTGPDPSFQPFPPCESAASYVTGRTSIVFGGGLGDNYDPPCLEVPVGATVTFSGDFGSHPLSPSTARGTLAANPITITSAGSTASFTFAGAGFWAYTCTVHGSDYDGQGMTGVVWAR